MTSFKAYQIQERPDGTFHGQFVMRNISELPDGDVLIEVQYSSLNYKDFLSASGHRGITRRFPHTPGVDAAGVVVESKDPTVEVGDEVFVTGHDLGMNTDGGFAEFVRVPAAWVVKRPKAFSLKDAMSFGTAGFTAAQCLQRFEDNHCHPKSGPILVTGSTGGVGSVAVRLLSHLGYEVHAATRNPSQHESFLKSIGARDIVDTNSLIDPSSKPLLKSKWAGVVDTVGGEPLTTAIRSTQQRAVITFCGMILSPDLHTTVFPFILRGLKLIGIDSAECPIAEKRELWARLATEWKVDLSLLTQELSMDDIPKSIEKLKTGTHRGRIVFNMKSASSSS